jgi:hypothetical protein
MKKYLLSLLSIGALSAEMVFDTKLIELKVGVDEQTVTAEFPFEIKREDAVIKNYDAPCSCLKAKIYPLNNDRSTKLEWKVGDTGKVIGKFNLGNFKGTVDKAIVLNFQGKQEPSKLTVRVSIPELFKIEPPTQQWNLGGGLKSKTYKITVNHSEPIHILEDSGTSENFPYIIKRIKDGWEYEVVVTPTQDKTPAMGMIRFHTDSKSKRFQRSQIFAVMRTPRPAAAKTSP